MTVLRTTACVVASLFFLAACSKAPAAGDARAATTSTTVNGHATAASDVSMPEIKPGLWEIKVSHVGGDGQSHGAVTQQCLDAAAMASAKEISADYVKENCSKNQTSRAGDTWTNDLVCKNGDGAMTTHTVTTMAGDGAYHTELSISNDPPTAGEGISATTMDGRWLGACKPT